MNLDLNLKGSHSQMGRQLVTTASSNTQIGLCCRRRSLNISLVSAHPNLERGQQHYINQQCHLFASTSVSPGT
jgi:hypothetical protein